MYQFYERKGIAPTFADLRDEEEVRLYANARERFLGGRLALPPLAFRGADVLEYGPDTGENAVVFARWGATMTVVEPAVAVHDAIRRYIDRFAPPNALRRLVTSDVLSYVPDQPYDIVVAEGFIHSVKPESAWLAAFARAIRPGGLVLISHYERTATLFEVSQKVPFFSLIRRTGDEPLAVAERCYRPKWDRIPHTRSFESWVMDVLENPYQQLPTMTDAEALVRDADAAGFTIHATWPSYEDALENGWGKRRVSREERLERTAAHIRRSVLTFVLGTKAYLVDDADWAPIRTLVDRAVDDTNALIHADDAERSHALAGTLRALANAARIAATLRDPGDAFERAVWLLEAWAAVHDDLGRSDDAAAVARLREDTTLLDGWGNANHFAVFRSRSGAD